MFYDDSVVRSLRDLLHLFVVTTFIHSCCCPHHDIACDSVVTHIPRYTITTISTFDLMHFRLRSLRLRSLTDCYRFCYTHLLPLFLLLRSLYVVRSLLLLHSHTTTGDHILRCYVTLPIYVSFTVDCVTFHLRRHSVLLPTLRLFALFYRFYLKFTTVPLRCLFVTCSLPVPVTFRYRWRRFILRFTL